MKVILLAGGLGTRLAEETARIPKPMVEVGGKPIIQHVMEIYAAHGYREFVVACGYKGVAIKRYFHDFHLSLNDFTVILSDGRKAMRPAAALDWSVSVVDTGETTMTGGRIKRLREWIGNETFMVTYSDGVGNIDIAALEAFHRRHGRLATVTAVRPPARFGNLELDGDQVTEFTEKVHANEVWINGGFFVLEPEVLDYIEGDAEPFERAPLAHLAADGELMAFRHRGFWHPMDTVRDRDVLNGFCAAGARVPWLDFAKPAPAPAGQPAAAEV